MTASDKLSSRKQSQQSPGLAFLLAAERAMPRSLADRSRSASMGDLMRIAIDCRMQFSRDEGPRLERLSLSSCVGVFRPLDEIWYTRACIVGGTFPGLWETYHRHVPWIAHDVFVGQGVRDQAQNHRVAPNMAVILPSNGEDDPDLPRIGDAFEVWWCTSMDRTADTITLCRYRLPADRRHPLTRDGQPRRRCLLDRKAWAELFPKRPRAAEQREAA